jgi:hypothetical protein
MRKTLVLSALIGAFLFAAIAPQAHAGSSRDRAQYKGVSVLLWEDDGSEAGHEHGPGAKIEVDAHSELLVKFNVAGTATTEAAPEWQRLNAVLSRANALLESFRQLDTVEVDLEDEAALRALRVAVRGHTSRLMEFSKELDGLAQEAGTSLDDIETGTHWETPGPPQLYRNAARWLREQIQALDDTGVAFAESLEKTRVTVQAFLDARAGGERTAVHVANYDQIPTGRVQPIPRFSLDMSEAERERLGRELNGARAAVTIINEVEQGRRDIKAGFQTLLRRLVDRLQAIVEQFDPGAGDWKAKIDGVMADLQEVEASGSVSQAQRDAATALLAQLRTLRSGVDKVDGLIRDVRALRESIESPSEVSLAALLSGWQQRVQGIKDGLDAVIDGVPAWVAAAQSLPGHVATLGEALARDEARDFLQRELVFLFVELAPVLPTTTQFVAAIAAGLTNAAKTSELADGLAGTRPDLVTRKVDELVDGRVSLKRTPITLGDTIVIEVHFFEADDAGAIGEPTYSVAYSAEIAFMGFHREISGDVIFARASSRPGNNATSWKPNVAAVANWHYGVRDPEGLEKVWSFLEPGAGLHVASLDMGADAVEFGVGAQLSLFGGFVSGGFGYNLSVDGNREYFVIGIDLLDVLNQLGAQSLWRRLEKIGSAP